MSRRETKRFLGGRSVHRHRSLRKRLWNEANCSICHPWFARLVWKLRGVQS